LLLLFLCSILPYTMQRVASAATVTAVGLLCKAFLNLGLATVTVNGLPTLLDALHSEERRNGRGIVTVSNHISTLDDPVTWGVLPTRCYLRSHTMRWSLGAADIMFTNPLFSSFFRLGQVLETFRGNGIYQPSIDSAIQKLDNGAWIHLFGEGKVNQQPSYQLPRFKWGVGRILMEAANPPLVIPMWLTGFNELMPEGRAFPYKYLPRVGSKLSITFGNPLPSDLVSSFTQVNHLGLVGSELDKVRSDVTARVHDAVEMVGRSVLHPR
jgi:monolysocardiolipin acyltransferase